MKKAIGMDLGFLRNIEVIEFPLNSSRILQVVFRFFTLFVSDAKITTFEFFIRSKHYGICSNFLQIVFKFIKKIYLCSGSRAVVPNGGGTAHRWALKRDKGAFWVQGKFGGR